MPVGYREVLSWTKNNEAFTTGVKEQMDGRADQLKKVVGFDVRDYLSKINSTFDYEETNLKTKTMLVQLITKKYNEGYKTIVYTDDKLENLKEFKAAAGLVKKDQPDFNYRLYHFLNDHSGLKRESYYWAIGSLYDLMGNKKIIGK